jgi:hypothetical protein
LITKEDFEKLDISKFEHVKMYTQLLSNNEEELFSCQESKSYKELLDKSVKMGTLNVKYNGDYFDVSFRNILGSSFAFYPEKKTIIISQSSLDRLL